MDCPNTDKLLAILEFKNGLTEQILYYGETPSVEVMEAFLETIQKDLNPSERIKVKKALKKDYFDHLKNLKKKAASW